MEKKSGSKLLNFVIFLIAVSIFAMGAFMYLKGRETNKDNKDDKETAEKEEVKDDNKNEIKELDETEIKELVGSYFKTKNPYVFSYIVDNGLNDNIKLKIALLNTSNYTEEYKCSDLFEVSGIYNAYFKATPDEKNSWGCMDSENSKSYLYDDLNDTYKKLFGSSLDAIKEGFDGTPTIDYSSEKDAYVVLNPRYNPVYEELYIYDIDSYNQDNENLDVVISYISYTNDYENKNLIYNIKLNDDSDIFVLKSIEEIAKYYANNKNDAYKLTLHFIYEDNHFILKNIEK